jgi:hypothetical protein
MFDAKQHLDLLVLGSPEHPFVFLGLPNPALIQ